MALKSGQSADNFNLKFLELKKYEISKENITGFETISIDNNHSNIFIINDSKLFVIPLNNLLSFEWNKSVVNEICQQFIHFAIDLKFRPHLVSVSGKGFGNKLAVCVTDSQSQTPFILFYDLKEVYKNQSKSSPYNRINLIPSSGIVSELVWHSEFGDNLFGCCVTDGSLFVVSIGDIETKSTAILSQLPSNSNSMSLCWSPKGKQLVVGHKNGFFSQYKLINGQQLQEVKKIYLINELKDYNVISIKWIVSSLFAIAITKDLSESDKDTHILLVSTPSKAEAQFVDFGSLCVDVIETGRLYKTTLFHFNNLIFCATSMSSEVALLGCDFDKEIAVLDNWCQWVLDDSSRIDLPMDNDGNETYLRGMAISKGMSNVYKLNITETYGGVDCPLLFVYTSAGILVPYLMIDKTKHLRGVNVPNIVKTTIVAPTPVPQPKPLTSTPIISTNSPQQSNNSQKSSFGTPVTPMTSFQPKADNKSFPNSPQTPKHSLPMSSHLTPNKQIETTITSAQTIAPTLAGDETDTRVVANELYESAIKDQIKDFNKLMNEMKKKYSKIETKIGEKEERMRLKIDSRLVEEVLKELKDNYKNCSKDITTLQSSLIESFSLLEEAKSIMDRNVDPKYRNLLRHKALDPITTRRLQEILTLNQYIETQLRELDAKFEQEWNELLEKKKAVKSKQMSRIQANSSLELVYKALNNNQRVINVLRHQLDRLEQLSSPSKTSISSEKQIIDKLIHNLNKSSLKDIPEDIFNERSFKLKSVSEKKKNNLKEFFENRSKVPFIRPVDNTSRFISAIEKIKEKQKSIEKTQSVSKKIESIGAKQSSEKSQTIVKSMDNKVDITPTVVNVAKSVEQMIPQKKSIDKTTSVAKTPLTVSSPDSKSVPRKITLGSQPSSIVSITGPTKTADIFQTSQQNSISFNLNSTPSAISSQPSPFSPIDSNIGITSQPFSFKPQISTQPFSTTTTTISTKSKVESPKKVEPEVRDLDITSNSSKSVSFGNTTIINPIETTTEDSFQLDTITELSEGGENTSTTDSPFSTFKGFGSFTGFGGNAPKDSAPKLAFNLSQPKPSPSTSGFSFNLAANANKPNESLPKYEDITPPSTPQKDVKKDITVTSMTSESQSSNPSSILKTTLSTKTPSEQNESKSAETSILRSLITGQTRPESSPVTTTVPIPISSITPISSPLTSPNITTPLQTSQSISQISITSGTVGKTSNEVPTPTSSTQTIASPFSSVPAFGQSATSQSPFATNFSFGNTLPNTSQGFQTSANQNLSFGFGANNQLNQSSAPTPTTTSSGGLSFGQQTNALNSMAFCGLGSAPNPENAQKNAFGGSFSNPPLQSGSQSPSFGTNTQSSPFSVKTPSSGLFGGSFSSGSAGVAQTGFGAFSGSSPQQQSPQQTQSAFGGSPLFGGSPSAPAFGGTPTFGGSPQSGFGSAATFGGPPALGALSGSAFGSQPNSAFGANTPFSNPANTGLSFGALASTAQPSAQNQSPFGGGFAFAGNADSFSFTQRRK